MESTATITLIKEFVHIKRRDVRKSQLDVITTLINGHEEKKDLLNQIVTELVTLTNVGAKYVRNNCIEFIIVVISGLGTVLE
jgi:uncharacterized protein (DUF697 family)